MVDISFSETVTSLKAKYEHIANKVSSITSSNKSSTDNYPSNKAITDYVDNLTSVDDSTITRTDNKLKVKDAGLSTTKIADTALATSSTTGAVNTKLATQGYADDKVKLNGTSTGGTLQPIYIKDSKATAGTQLYNKNSSVNGTTYSHIRTTNSDAFTIYAPTSKGTDGQILRSNGGNTPYFDSPLQAVNIKYTEQNATLNNSKAYQLDLSGLNLIFYWMNVTTKVAIDNTTETKLFSSFSVGDYGADIPLKAVCPINAKWIMSAYQTSGSACVYLSCNQTLPANSTVYLTGYFLI